MDSLFLTLTYINLFFQNLGDWLVVPMKLITNMGSEQFFMLAIPLLYWTINTQIGLRVGFMLLLSNGINTLFKFLFHQPRPFWVNPEVKAMVEEGSFGLPSGHAQNAASIWGVIAYSINKPWATALILLFILLTGISRIFLGVHYLTDVMAGWLIGLILLALFTRYESAFVKWFKTQNVINQVVIAVLSSFLFIILPLFIKFLYQNWQVPQEWVMNASVAFPESKLDPYALSGSVTVAGTWVGMLLGLILLQAKSITYKPNGTIFKRILQLIIGLIGIIVLWMGLDQVFPDGETLIPALFRYIRYALVGIWVSALAPLVFKALKLSRF